METTDFVTHLALPLKATLTVRTPEEGGPVVDIRQRVEVNGAIQYEAATLDGEDDNPYMNNVPLGMVRQRLEFLLATELAGKAERKLMADMILAQMYYDAGVEDDQEAALAALEVMAGHWDQLVAARTGILGMVFTDQDDVDDLFMEGGSSWDPSLGNPPRN